MPNDTRSSSQRRIDLPNQLQDDIRDSIRDHLAPDTDPAESGSARKKQVTPDVCALMRHMHAEGVPMKQVAREFEWVAYQQVRYHINGECACDESAHVHEDECYRMRMYAHQGAPADTLALLNDLEKKTVWRHLSGRCHHPDGMPPVETDNGPTPYTATADD